MRRQQETLIHDAAVQSLENRKTQGLDKDGKTNAFVKRGIKSRSSACALVQLWRGTYSL